MNKIRTLRKSIDKNEAQMTTELYSTLIGSIVSSIGCLKGFTPRENYKFYRTLKKDMKSLFGIYNTVEKICTYVNETYGKVPLLHCYLAKLVLVFSTNDFWAPVVTIASNEGEILPLSPDGIYYGILAQIGRDEVCIEPVYEF